jgi:hypothetical protein
MTKNFLKTTQRGARGLSTKLVTLSHAEGESQPVPRMGSGSVWERRQ